MKTDAHKAGYVRFYRSLLDNPLVTQVPPAWTRVFVVIMLKVNWKPGTWWDGKKTVTTPPGSMITSVEKLAGDAHVSVKQTRNCLAYLKSANVAAIVTTSHYTRITLLNWDTYQGRDYLQDYSKGKPNGKAGANEGQGDGKAGATIKEGNQKNIQEEARQHHQRDDAACTPEEQGILELAGVRRSAANLKALRGFVSAGAPIEQIRGGVALGRLRHMINPSAGPIASFRFFANPIAEAGEAYQEDQLEHTIRRLKRELSRQTAEAGAETGAKVA